MQDLYQRQIELENEYSTASIAAGQQAVLDAFTQGRATDIGAGRILLAKAYEAAIESFSEFVNKPSRGVLGKYKVMLRNAAPEVLVMAGLREVISACAVPEPVPMQDLLRRIGRVIESETMLVFLDKLNPVYTARTLEYLDSVGTKSITHRYRTLLAGTNNLGIQWDSWSMEERIGTAKILLTHLYDTTGLFKWELSSTTQYYHIQPSEVLAKHFDDIQDAARAVVKFPPMLVKPADWVAQHDGGYVTEWFRMQAPMCGLRFLKRNQREWILNTLESAQSEPVRAAMNKAQSTPYRINKQVLAVLREAVSTRLGILGLPSSQPRPQPVFPFPEGWLKEHATAGELEQFKLWKEQMRMWYSNEAKRMGRKAGILSRLRELVRYQDEQELYFPTFIDWRGRMYFRSVLNPQSNDAVKGCLDFAEGKPLGEEGLFWLKVHVANSCGYDKHSPEIKAKWTEDNWSMICDFLNNPLDVDAPEPDTAFTLLQAGLALQQAYELSNPEEYVCHVPVAMDATCSGLQHLSALTRDTVGATYTNLINNHEDKKSDIYMKVAEEAKESLPALISDEAVQQFWADRDITRAMAKKPVMTLVYGSTLLSTIEGLALELSEAGVEPVRNAEGRIAYSLNALAVPVGKALRQGVGKTVPKAVEIMSYLQKIVRKHKETCMQWVTPVGVPVVNWAEGDVMKLVFIRSMGVKAIWLRYSDGAYNTRIASNGIVPNFVHSMDSAHLCMTINDAECSILPIHDSFATHPSDVPEMHRALRSTFEKMYTDFNLDQFLEFNGIDSEKYPIPEQGDLDIKSVNTAPYMFC